METMGDLLEKVREFASYSFTKEEAQKLFGWNVRDIAVKSAESDESYIYITFENQYTLFIRYFLNLDPTETEDTCEFTLGLRTDLRSRIKIRHPLCGLHPRPGIHPAAHRRDKEQNAADGAGGILCPGLKECLQAHHPQVRGLITVATSLAWRRPMPTARYFMLRFATGASTKPPASVR